jgi:dTDP-3-amino-3,4,6-trideoxy-alpha-D-glucose transaminase
MVGARAAVPLTTLDNQDPELLRELLAAVEQVAASAAFIGGEFVERFEAAFAAWCEAPHAVGVSSGTEALILTMRALRLRAGDEVLVPANSFVATAEAVCLAGGTPRFADVDPVTQLVSAESLEAALTPRVRGIIPVHLFGRTVQMDAVSRLAHERELWLVEDCAQAHGARFDGRRVGTWGNAGTFSFYPAKNLGAWGDAGAVITADAQLAERLELLRSHGERPRYHHRLVGTTGRLDAVQAAVLERKLGRLECWNAARRRLAGSLREALAGCEWLDPPAPAPVPADHVYHQFVIRTRWRDQLREHLAGEGIATGVHYPVAIHRSPAFRALAGERDVAPTASRLAGEILSLPIFPRMRTEQVERVAEAVGDFRPSTRAGARAA